MSDPVRTTFTRYLYNHPILVGLKYGTERWRGSASMSLPGVDVTIDVTNSETSDAVRRRLADRMRAVALELSAAADKLWSPP